MEVDSATKDAPRDSVKDAESAVAFGVAAAASAAAIAVVARTSLPEIEVYLSTLALTTLLRHEAKDDAVAVAPRLLERAVSFNRRYAVGGGGGGEERTVKTTILGTISGTIV